MKLRPQIAKGWRALTGLLVQPLLAAFLPAVVLGGLWFGLRGALAVAAVALPVVAVANRGARANPATLRDRITGLPGQDLALDDIADDLARGDRNGRATCVVVIAVEDLSQMASTHGQDATDFALRTIARRLQECVCDTDSVARLNDGRYAVLAARPRRMDATTAAALSERLKAACLRPIACDAAQLLPRVTVGVALDTQLEAATARALLNAASMANREAARTPATPVRIYSDGMRKSVVTRHDLSLELRHAFDNGQIEPWYQPQLCTETGRIAGFEALARWQHPERGIIPPGEFLEAIEIAGLMARLGETMLFHALAALRAWDRAGLAVDTIGVNFSDTELRDPRLVDRVRWELDRFDILPERLCVEVLENVVADSEDDVVARNIDGLARMGCRIDLDDFGTGHASITNIRRFAVTRLKIDRSFVFGLERDEEQRKLVSAILTMARQLDLETLAEGVETAQAHDLLSRMGCEFVQGFGIGRPMPFEDTIPWIKARLKGVQTVVPLKQK